MGLTKIPSAVRLQQQIDTLEKELSSVCKEFDDLKKQQTKLDIVRENFEHLLMVSPPDVAPQKAPSKASEESL
jgi:SMC interacting uncharacterized protein involved in chromosome segregation